MWLVLTSSGGSASVLGENLDHWTSTWFTSSPCFATPTPVPAATKLLTDTGNTPDKGCTRLSSGYPFLNLKADKYKGLCPLGQEMLAEQSAHEKLTDRQQPRALLNTSKRATTEASLPLATSSLHTCRTRLTLCAIQPWSTAQRSLWQLMKREN